MKLTYEKLAWYQQEARRTYPDLGKSNLNDRHMLYGVITEVGEFVDSIKKFLAYKKPLDVVNLGEELADMMWYIVNDMTNKGVKVQLKTGTLADMSLNKRVEIDEESLNACVEGVMNSADLTVGIESYYDGICTLVSVAFVLGLDFEQLLTNNINKLRVRFPDKFDADRAINRDLDAERNELEK